MSGPVTIENDDVIIRADRGGVELLFYPEGRGTDTIRLTWAQATFLARSLDHALWGTDERD